MKNLLIIITVLLLASCSASKKGIKVAGFHQGGNSYWQNQANKIVHRNQRYARMEARSAKKEDKMMKNILQANAKAKRMDKKYLAQTFDHH